MWFIFPQLAGLGYSETAKFYAIQNLEEAQLYLQDKILAERLITISKALLQSKGKTAHQIFGSPDDLKLQSSMTLFSTVKGAGLFWLKSYFHRLQFFRHSTYPPFRISGFIVINRQ